MTTTNLLIFISLCTAWIAFTVYARLKAAEKANEQRNRIIAELEAVRHAIGRLGMKP